MQRKQRKIPLLTLAVLLIGGGIFSIKFFASASKPAPSLLRDTQTIAELSAEFSPSKVGTFRWPEVIIISELNGKVVDMKVTAGDEVRGGQPLLGLADEFWGYTSQLEITSAILDTTQELYDKTQSDFFQQWEKAEASIAEFQHQIKQVEEDLQAILTQPLNASKGSSVEIESDSPLNDDDASIDILKQALLQSLSKIEQQLEQAKVEYEVLKTEQSSQLVKLQQNLQSARNEYESAYTIYNKLSIRATLAGMISRIFVEEGESVFAGSPLFSLIPHAQAPTLEVPLSFEEYLSVLNITGVQIGFSGEGTGSIISRSPVANEEGKYLLSIESSRLSGQGEGEVEVRFPLETLFFYLPKELIEIKNQTSGNLYLLIDNEVQKFPVQLGHQRNGFIEISSPINPATLVVRNWKSVY